MEMKMLSTALALTWVALVAQASSDFWNFSDSPMSLVSLEEYIDELTNQTTEIRYQREPELLPQNYEKNLYSYGKFQPMETTNKTKIFRTYGRGKVEIGKGQSAYVPNTVPQKNVDKDKSDTNKARKGPCRICPPNRTVIATKGNNFVILPQPCPSNRWTHLSGPRPGSEIYEGLHKIKAFIGVQKKLCQYNYQVIVRRCEPLRPLERGTTIKCTNNYIWGSKCTVLCGKEKEPNGPNELECTDGLTWSNPVPKCKSVSSCTVPKIKSRSKITCQTGNLTQTQEEFIPDGSLCRFIKRGRPISIICKAGTWRIRRRINSRQRNNAI